MATVGFQQDFQVFPENSSGEFQLCADDLVLFSGNNDQLTFMRGGMDTIVAEGTNQTIETGLCSANAIYLLGHHTNLEFYEGTSGTTMVYGGAQDGAMVTMMAGEIAVETPYRNGFQWGSQVTVHAASGGGILSTVDFAYDPLVPIKVA
jgi:hypothetical protein